MVISGAAALLVLLHLVFPKWTIDSTTIVLLVMAIIPWLDSLFTSLELPGGLKVQFRALENAGRKITATGAVPEDNPTPDASYLASVTDDPNLALVGLRIEIEHRIRTLSQKNGVEPSRSLSGLVRELGRRGVLPPRVVSGLLDIVGIGNSAAHGARFDREATDWAFRVGPEILKTLDRYLD